LTTRGSTRFSRSSMFRTLWSNNFKENTNSNCETWGYRGGDNSVHMYRYSLRTTSRHIPHYSCLPINTSNLVTHPQKRHAVSIPQSLPVGYVNALAKLCGVKRMQTYAKARTLQSINASSGRIPNTVHSRTYYPKRLFHVIYKHLHVNDRPMLQNMDIILSHHYRFWRPLSSLILYIVTADWPVSFGFEERQQLTNYNVQIKYWPWMSRPGFTPHAPYSVFINP
jgi:hypothetical protein